MPAVPANVLETWSPPCLVSSRKENKTTPGRHSESLPFSVRAMRQSFHTLLKRNTVSLALGWEAELVWLSRKDHLFWVWRFPCISVQGTVSVWSCMWCHTVMLPPPWSPGGEWCLYFYNYIFRPRDHSPCPRTPECCNRKQGTFKSELSMPSVKSAHITLGEVFLICAP